jgi:hypothetical protein
MFLTECHLVVNAERPGFWWTGAPLTWEAEGFSITVPPGFRTDLASIPRVIEWAPDLDVTGRSRRPGVLHDWLYGAARWVGKAQADEILRAACIAEGMDERGATAIYEGVHLFGRAAWDEDGTESVASMFRTPTHYQQWLATGPRLNPAS